MWALDSLLRHGRPPFLSSLRSSTPFITFTIAYSVFTEQFLFALIIPVAPFALQQRIHTPKKNVQYWVAILLASYGAASLLSSAPWGWWSDRHKARKLPFLLGLILTLGATITLWLARSAGLMVFGRICQGISSTCIWVTGFAMLVDTVGEAQIGKYMGYVGIALNIGTLTGPTLGGVVFASAGYDAVFAMGTGLVVVDVLLRLLMLERPRDIMRSTTASLVGPEDVEHIRAEIASAEVDKVPSTKSPSQLDVHVAEIRTSSSVPSTPASNMVGSASDEVIYPRSRKSIKDRLPPVISLLMSWRCLTAMWGIMIQTIIYSGFQATLPLELHRMFGWKSTGGGLIFIALIVPGLAGPLAGMLSDKIGPKWPATIGFLGLCPSLILMRLVEHDTLSQQVLLCVLLLFVGVFMTLLLEPLMAEITYLGGGVEDSPAVVESDGQLLALSTPTSYAQAYSLMNVAWSLGDTIGSLWAGFLIDASGFKTLTLSFGLLCGISAIPQALMCGGWLFDQSLPAEINLPVDDE